MYLYPCELTFHDHLFYETRTLGRLYETGRLLHNIALCYALGFAQTTYYHAEDRPKYAAEFAELNAAGVYVTPAAGEAISYVMHTFKLGDEAPGLPAHIVQERRNVNRPSFGRAKEIAIGSRFRFGVLSATALSFPHWVRMGLWLSKARLMVGEAIPLRLVQGESERLVNVYPINPTDLPDTADLRLFDLVSMRPSSLVENALIAAGSWWIGAHPRLGELALPAGLQHRLSI
jgi:CRISPR-associated protein Csc1